MKKTQTPLASNRNAFGLPSMGKPKDVTGKAHTPAKMMKQVPQVNLEAQNAQQQALTAYETQQQS